MAMPDAGFHDVTKMVAQLKNHRRPAFLAKISQRFDLF
jgi:hypothetical protein